MNVQYVLHDADGQLIGSGHCQKSVLEANTPAGMTAVLVNEPVSLVESYVRAGKILPRPEFAPTVDGTTVFGFPVGTRAVTEGHTFVTDDGEFDFQYSLPGTYPVEFTLFPYKPFRLEIAA